MKAYQNGRKRTQTEAQVYRTVIFLFSGNVLGGFYICFERLPDHAFSRIRVNRKNMYQQRISVSSFISSGI
jgi:hypothetical protein